MIITKRNSDPMWKMDQMVNAMMNSKYPNDSSIINDSLRGEIQEAYNINLNMFDTHRFMFAAYNGILESDEYFFYEGPYEKIKAFYDEDKYQNYWNHILGTYPEGIFLGFFATEFKDPEWRKSHMREYGEFLYAAMNLFHDKAKDASAYSWYLDYVANFYIFKRMYEEGCDITCLQDIKYEPYSCIFNFDLCLEQIDTIIDHKEEFIKAAKTYRYAAIYRFFDKYLCGDDYCYDREAIEQLQKKLGIYEATQKVFNISE